MPTVLQLFAQRPALTGSGVTIDALAREVARAGWDQHVVIGAPIGEMRPTVDGLPDERIHPLHFGTLGLPFAMPGMSDVMPYSSSVFGEMTDADWDTYREAWRTHVAEVVERTRPDLIHAHHVWILSGLVKDIAPDIPLVVHCHATGLRQLARAHPGRAEQVALGCRRADAFVVLHEHHLDALVDALGVPQHTVHVVGAGYSPDCFHARGRDAEPESILFAGKLAMAKGVPPLLDAFECLLARRPDARLHIAGEGSGEEGARIRERVQALAPEVVFHGRLGQRELAELMRRSAVLTLPSFYEGLPLVLVEARACGCRLVTTALPGIGALAEPLADALDLVDLPLVDVDRPDPGDLPSFVDRLEAALDHALEAPPCPADVKTLEEFTWQRVFTRIEAVWQDLLDGPAEAP